MAENPKGEGMSRRSFLTYTGAGTLLPGTLFVQQCRPASTSENPIQALKSSAWLPQGASLPWVQPPYPIPLAQENPNHTAERQNFEVIDDLVLPDGFAYRVIAEWGQEFPSDHYPGGKVRFGFNCDYTGLVPIANRPEEFWLWVNHEDISFFAWQQGYGKHSGRRLPQLMVQPGSGEEDHDLVIDGIRNLGRRVDFGNAQTNEELKAKLREVCETALHDLGGSILHVRREKDGHIQVIQDSKAHKRISTWSHQNAEELGLPPVRLSGPSKALFGPDNASPPGSFGNCSGGTTPWGTFLTCEENIQNHTHEWIDETGALRDGQKQVVSVSPHRARTGQIMYLNGMGNGLSQPLDGRHFGWVCEIDPETGAMTKHSHLGRFRHENVALRVQAQQPLAAYMGDDRRGGHVWKYLSTDPVSNPTQGSNSSLFEKGTLYGALFNPDFTGSWIPLLPETALVKPQPQHAADGILPMPKRPGGGPVAVGLEGSDRVEMTPEQWVASIETFTNKPFDQCTLGDLVNPGEDAGENGREARLAIILADAYLMGNAAGMTPTARPEDLETHPIDQSVYIAFTDNTGSSWGGSPDQRIFVDAKRENSRQYGSVFRLQDDRTDAKQFTWGVFVPSGEVAEKGGGFACADNLVFDPAANLWMVTDISQSSLNQAVDRTGRTAPGQTRFRGIFGNNAMFAIPTAGPHAGVPFLFAVGPCECELTGPTFTDDGKTLVLAVQHPGEYLGTRTKAEASEERQFVLADREGKLFNQTRQVPLGSNFPSGNLDEPPRPTVVSIVKLA